MATQHRRTLALRDDPHLARYIVEGKTTGNVLGIGSYGSVEEVIVEGHGTCAGKKIHDILMDSANIGVGDITKKYLQECQLMSSLCHPNITRFIGLCFIVDSRLPVLVMEKLDGNLDDLLETVPCIPLALKRSILEDIAKGLRFLHTHSQQIIHRDLTAKNVLLTSTLVAKITDLGNSRIVHLQAGQLVQTMSQLPGTLVYMPPEAFSFTTRYGPSLDVFSFGHLALFTLTQVFPVDLLESTYPNPNDADIVLARSEVERRQRYFDILNKEILASKHSSLTWMVKRCLQNAPSRRPTMEEIAVELQRVKTDLEDVSGSTVYIPRADAVKQITLSMEMFKKAKVIEEELCEKNIFIQQKDAQLNEIHLRIEHLQGENARLTDQQREKERALHIKDDRIKELEARLQEKDLVLCQKESNLQRIQAELQNLQATLSHENDGEPLTGALDGYAHQSHDELIRKEFQHKQTLRLPLELHWKTAKNMPIALGWYPVMVMIKEKLYVGSGLARSAQVKQSVMEYDYSQGEWTTLPLYLCAHFGMAALNDDLVLFGGILTSTGKKTSIVGVWNEKSQSWTHPLPPMPTARRSPSVVTHKDRWLVVIGGRCEDRHTQLSVVEILDTKLGQWYTGESSPHPLSHGSVAMVGGSTCYLIGGFVMKGTPSKKTFRVDLEDLVCQATATTTSQTPSTTSTSRAVLRSPWLVLPNTPHIHSSALALHGTLLAVGGEDIFASKSIFRYEPDAAKWIKAGELASSRMMCACLAHSNRIFVAGGMSAIIARVVSTNLMEIAEYHDC